MIMEAARILAATGVRPKRTIRFALWAGEEQGMLGSLAYVEKHLATRGSPSDPRRPGWQRYYGWANRWPITPQPGYGDLAAYFNIDNGSGKLRGIYAENNPAVVPIFREWLAPFASMGATHGGDPARPAAPTTSSCRRSACPASSSSRTRSITTAASTTRRSTRSIT